MVRELLIKGNSKMGPKVYLFNLPPKQTCTPTHWCLHGKDGKPACYAQRNNFNLPSVVKSARERLRLSRRQDFVSRMVEEIHKKNPGFFRWHSSGDFYSEEYVRKIIDIVSQCPDVLFRTTTRRRDLADVIQELNDLPNMIVRESLDYERPEPVMGLPYAALSSLAIVQQGKPLKCVNDCTKCGHKCWKKPVNMYFEEH
jgi:hypothetical protein